MTIDPWMVKSAFVIVILLLIVAALYLAARNAERR